MTQEQLAVVFEKDRRVILRLEQMEKVPRRDEMAIRWLVREKGEPIHDAA